MNVVAMVAGYSSPVCGTVCGLMGPLCIAIAVVALVAARWRCHVCRAVVVVAHYY